VRCRREYRYSWYSGVDREWVEVRGGLLSRIISWMCGGPGGQSWCRYNAGTIVG